ncbi:hypothetical protein [Bizionia paragorgiae]|jgi:hypothetical protein|uniref:Glutaminyl-tRNA synthetase n=1 Tax=Bizionia paragorgiae TaxID=283786 RepID=A0A1H3Y0W4_BIZPA|nr:hypothetical protein [Bizionia paragorgiae]MDX1270585.1 hypothetical protein [Bizionia paragorgiae]SEA05319.1 hypothetical protein SAMN04487990_1067 [Bizionia paragorgiae]
MKTYKTLEDIEFDLKRLTLERNIALEEMKAAKGQFKESLQPAEWMQTGFKMLGKVGVMMIVKKIFRR